MQNYESGPKSVIDDESARAETEEKNSRTQEAQKKLAAELEAKQKAELRVELEAELKTELEEKLRSELQAELKIEFETVHRPRLEAKLKMELEEELKAELQTKSELDSKSETELITESKEPTKFIMETKRIIEAILFSANKPMTAKQIQKIYPEFEQPELKEIQAAIELIIEDYTPRPIGLKCLASGYKFQVKEGFSYWISRLFEEKPAKYSRASLETVAIIAYRQPVTRGDIEDIRGVGVSSNIIHTLLEREWIRVIAHKEVPGRPALYGTTKHFLDYFNLSSLEQLPPLEEINDSDFSIENPDTPDNQQSDKLSQIA